MGKHLARLTVSHMSNGHTLTVLTTHLMALKILSPKIVMVSIVR